MVKSNGQAIVRGGFSYSEPTRDHLARLADVQDGVDKHAVAFDGIKQGVRKFAEQEPLVAPDVKRRGMRKLFELLHAFVNEPVKGFGASRTNFRESAEDRVEVDLSAEEQRRFIRRHGKDIFRAIPCALPTTGGRCWGREDNPASAGPIPR